MKRRTLLGALGGLGGASSLSFATGAFSYTRADRELTAVVADDSQAYLKLEQIGDGTGRSVEYDDPEQVRFHVPGLYEDEVGGTDPDGVGTDSVYEFHDLVRITNQGTQSVAVYGEYDGTTFAALGLTDDSGPLSESDPRVLGVGESFDAGVYIDSHGTALGEYEETLTIVAR